MMFGYSQLTLANPPKRREGINCLRILFASGAGVGHLRPLLPLARALRARGCDIRIAAPPNLSSMIANEGLIHFVTDLPAQQDVQPILERAYSKPYRERNEIIFSESFAGTSLRAALPKMQKAINEWQPDLLIRESIEYSSLVAAEVSGIPHMRVEVLNAFSEDATIGDTLIAIDTARSSAGLEPDHGAAIDREPAFSSFPEAIDGSCIRRGQTQFRFAPDQDAVSDTEAGSWPEQSELPFVYMTFGTLSGRVKDAQRIYRISIEAVKDLPINVLLTTGRDYPVDLPEVLPANVMVREWASQTDVLARADLLIFHGGSGSMQGALVAGVPMVVTPMFADQHDNAYRIEEAGIGRSVSTLSSHSISSTIERVLSDPKFASNARELALQIAEMPTVDDAADKVLTFLNAE